MKPISRLSELFEDWQYFAEHDGIKASLPIIATDIARLPYRRLKFVIEARSLLDPFPIWQPKILLMIRPFEKADLDWVRRMDRPSEARLCEQRLHQNHIGLMAFHEGKPAGYTWGSTDVDTQLERVHPKLCPGDFLCTDSYTSPEYRGQGLQTALTLARFQLFQKLGYSRAVCTIEIHNSPSLAVWQKKLNSQTIGTIDFTRFGAWYRVRYCESNAAL